MRLLLVDNYDSFTFNLKHLIECQDNVTLDVCRNDDNFLDDLKNNKYAGVFISPGPGSPEDKAYFGHNKELILDYGTKGLPILGVCLGFQGIYHCFGGNLKLGKHPVHGKTSQLSIEKEGVILKDVPEKTTVMRYHSILADTTENIPEYLEITAYAYNQDNTPDYSEPMALEHKEFPIYGVQFHPESFATSSSALMIQNFLSVCRGKHNLIP